MKDIDKNEIKILEIMKEKKYSEEDVISILTKCKKKPTNNKYEVRV